MNKLYTLAITMLMAPSFVNAKEEVPVFFSENFSGIKSESTLLASGWLTYGNGATPAGIMADYFQGGEEAPNFILWNYGSATYAMACTNFEPSTPADQWLVTPEVEVSADAVELSFTAALYNNSKAWGTDNATFRVMVSLEGAGKESFEQISVAGANIKPSSVKEVTTKNYFVPLAGYGGKKIRLAFVVDGENVGMTGFSDIKMGNYAITFTNSTPEVTAVGEEIAVEVNVGMKTPVACPGFTAVLNLDNGSEPVSCYFKKNLGGAGTSYTYQYVQFEPIVCNEPTSVDYSVEITPDYEGAPTSVLYGSFGVPEVAYLSNVVVEELTATGCGWCPAGTASLDYYHHTYPGTETEGKVIPIAIHGFMNYYDPMNEGVAEYVSQVMDANGITGLPQAIFNRNSSGLGPDNKAEVEKQIAQPSYNDVRITKVKVPDGDPWGKRVVVDFEVRNAYSSGARSLNAAAVLLEDNVAGNDAGYNQTNYFYNHDASFVRNNYGDFLVPYIEKYLQGGELGYQMVPFNEMVYNHVARGIYPDFHGQALASEWTADVAQEFSLGFTLPETLGDLSATSVAILIISENTGAIVASDIMSASGYEKSGVDNVIDRSEVKSRINGKILEVEAPAGTLVNVYSVDGRLIGGSMSEGTALTFPLDGHGIYLIRTDGATITTKKIVY